jgi:uncharacterized protein
MSMHLEGSAQRLTIFCGESDKAAHPHKPLHVEIVQRARKAGLAGATALRGVEGFGASSVVHTTASCRCRRTCRRSWSSWTPRS